jgi:hypothetical protein
LGSPDAHCSAAAAAGDGELCTLSGVLDLLLLCTPVALLLLLPLVLYCLQLVPVLLLLRAE